MFKAKCDVCDEFKDKIPGWRGKTKVYHDTKNHQWDFRTCPDCRVKELSRLKYHNAQKKKNAEQAIDYVLESMDTNPITHRLCRLCKQPLRAHRYFDCNLCIPHGYNNVLDEFLYNSFGIDQPVKTSELNYVPLSPTAEVGYVRSNGSSY